MLSTPNKENVRAACERFDQEFGEVEQALQELFARYPANHDLSHVLLKVVAVNSLYSTRIPVYSEKIPNVVDVSKHIHQNALKIDAALASGSPETIAMIAQISTKGKSRNNFSFATKYCSWHKPESYPIWDSNVGKCLGRLQKQSNFASDFNVNSERWTYSDFCVAMKKFRHHFDLGSFTFKEIDKFLWLYGDDLS
ncbi:MAG: hypothetical protein ABI811_23145 [Acidobacteriota bacterium]